MTDREKISMALLAQAGLGATNVRAVTYHHRVGEWPTLIAECYIYGDSGDPDIESREFEWRPKETE